MHAFQGAARAAVQRAWLATLLALSWSLPSCAATYWKHVTDFQTPSGIVRKFSVYYGARNPNHQTEFPGGLMGFPYGWTGLGPHPLPTTLCVETTRAYSHILYAGERTWRCSQDLWRYEDGPHY